MGLQMYLDLRGPALSKIGQGLIHVLSLPARGRDRQRRRSQVQMPKVPDLGPVRSSLLMTHAFMIGRPEAAATGEKVRWSHDVRPCLGAPAAPEYGRKPSRRTPPAARRPSRPTGAHHLACGSSGPAPPAIREKFALPVVREKPADF